MTVRDRIRRLGRTTVEVQAEELMEESGADGADRIGEVADRAEVTVYGRVVSVTLPPKSSIPALFAELWDGSGSVDLVFIGRRRIAGVVPGATIRARGRVSRRHRTPRIYNPFYELIPS